MFDSLVKEFKFGVIEDSLESLGDFLLLSTLPKDGDLMIILTSNSKSYYTQLQRKSKFKFESIDANKLTLQEILTTLESLHNKTIWIEDQSHFLYMGIPLTEILDFTQQLYVISITNSLNILTKVHDDTPELNIHLRGFSDLYLKVEKLPSGFTDGIDGQVIIKRGPVGDSVIDGLLLYRIHESGVHWFTRGNI